jgi:hypothetical protein
MNKIKIFEKTDKGWVEGLDFGYVPVGKFFVTKTLCFSPEDCDVADLKVMVEDKKDFIFTKSNEHLYSDWKSITPFKIRKGEFSEPIQMEFFVKSGPVRLDNLKMSFTYLEIPEE